MATMTGLVIAVISIGGALGGSLFLFFKFIGKEPRKKEEGNE